MDFIGYSFIVLGSIGLVAGMIGLVLARREDGGYGQFLRPSVFMAGAAVLSLVIGFLLSDIRQVADLIGMLLLASTLVLALLVLALSAGSWLRDRRATAAAIVSAIALLLAIVGVILVALVTVDLVSLLVISGFVFLFVGLVVAIVGLVWFLVALIRRRGRTRPATFAGVAVSIAVAGLVGIAILAPRPPSTPESMTSAADLDQYLEDLVKPESPSGVSVVVIKDGETVYNKAFGQADGPEDIAATPDTNYHWYSVTKIVTAIATMQLVDQGLIALDDPVSDYLTFFEPDYPSESSEPVTIADLLNHSSGLEQNVPAVIGWLHLENDPALDQTEFLQDTLPDYDNLMFEPGSEGFYTNVGYYTLAGVIEQVSGQGYREYVVEHVLDPLGMTNTRFAYTDAMRDDEAVGAHPLADPLTIFIPLMDVPWPADYIRSYDGGQIWFERFLFDGDAPSGLIGPAPEMARLVSAVLNGGELDGARILSQVSVDVMLTEHFVEPGDTPEAEEYAQFDEMQHGLGWFVARDGDRLHHSHTGGGPGFAAGMRLYPEEGLGIVILANGTNLAYQDISDAIATIEW